MCASNLIMFNTRRELYLYFHLYFCCEEEMCLQSNSFQPQEENCLFWLCWAGNCESKWHHCRNENTSNVSVSKREKAKKPGTPQPFLAPFFASFSIFSWQLTLFAPSYVSISSMMMRRRRKMMPKRKLSLKLNLCLLLLWYHSLFIESQLVCSIDCLFVCLDALQVCCNSVELEYSATTHFSHLFLLHLCLWEPQAWFPLASSIALVSITLARCTCV